MEQSTKALRLSRNVEEVRWAGSIRRLPARDGLASERGANLSGLIVAWLIKRRERRCPCN